MKTQKVYSFRHIAFIYHGAIDNKFSGESVYLSSLISFLRKKFDVYLIDGTIYDGSSRKDSKIFLLLTAYIKFLGFFIGERKKPKGQRTKAFFCEDLYISILVIGLAKLSKVKFIYRPSDIGKDYRHALSKMHFISPLFYFFSYLSEIVLVKLSDIFVSVSPRITNNLITYGVKKEDIIYFPFIVKQKLIYENDKVDTFKAKYHLNAKIVIVFVGSPNYPPNLESIKFIVSLAKEIENKKDIVFLIVGKGTENIDISSFQNIVVLGAVDDLDTVLFSSHIGLSPSLVPGGLITKVVDYLVHGLLVLSTEEGGSGIINNEHLIICNRKNFAYKLIEIYADLKSNKIRIGEIPDIVKKTYIDETHSEKFPDLLYNKITESI